ncbi:MAG: right-handed parallel beta-helix repeat-containing protein [Planctomycetota bacterium]|jgi:predicted outer membrane repeat protein
MIGSMLPTLKKTVAIVSVALAATVTNGQSVRYVDDDASLGGDGLTWLTAYEYLQDALFEAAANPAISEIRVAGGVYRPDQAEGGNVTPGDREATFQLLTGVEVKGGYAGLANPSDPDEQDINIHETILSGDLSGNDGPDFDNNDENSYHVVTGSGTNETALLEGLTVTGGNANGPPEIPRSQGGGMYNDGGSPTVTDCVFNANWANQRGGGMYNIEQSDPTVMGCMFSGNSSYFGSGGGMCNMSSSPTVTDCTFSRNTTWRNGGGIYNGEQSNPTVMDCMFGENWAYEGGGMYNANNTPTVTRCMFVGNEAFGNLANGWGGRGGGLGNYASDAVVVACTFERNRAWRAGGMANLGGSPTVINCVFSGNSVRRHHGGGMYNGGSSPIIVNCVFVGNSAEEDGGGIYEGSGCQSTVTNCSFAGNLASSGAGMACFSSATNPSSVVMTNCILWDGGDEITHSVYSTITITYSDIQGGWPGDGNIDADPLFVPGPVGCLYLSQTAAGQAADSPCLDAGSDTAANMDLDTMTTRSDESVDAGIVDMGYHHPVSGLPLVMGDYDHDQDVDLGDFAGFQNCFTGERPADVSPCCRIFDFEPDADVDLVDLSGFQEALTGPLP